MINNFEGFAIANEENVVGGRRKRRDRKRRRFSGFANLNCTMMEAEAEAVEVDAIESVEIVVPEVEVKQPVEMEALQTIDLSLIDKF